MGLSTAREQVFSDLSPRFVLAAMYAGVKSITRTTSQHNPSLGSDASDKERKRQTQLELQELDSMYQQEPELDFEVAWSRSTEPKNG